jgi:hypothetical protein
MEADLVGLEGAENVRLFGKWSYEDVKAQDISLEASLGI